MNGNNITTIDVYVVEHNGVAQERLKFPVGTKWVRRDFERPFENIYWTIVPKNKYNRKDWVGPFETHNVLTKHVLVTIRNLEDHPYFESYGSTAKKMTEQLRTSGRVFACINDSTKLCALAKVGSFEELSGPVAYINFTTGGVYSHDQFGIYVNPHNYIAELDTYTQGRWIEVAPSKALKLWSEAYRWVLDKHAFIDRPCPIILSCKTKGYLEKMEPQELIKMAEDYKAFKTQFVNNDKDWDRY